jgi:serine protease Do
MSDEQTSDNKQADANHQANIHINNPHPHNLPETARGRLLTIALMVMLSAAFGFLGGRVGQNQDEDTASVEQQQVVLEERGELIRKIAQDVGQSVVSITTVQSVEGGYFGVAEQKGAGTGFILTEDGLIATNRHVVPSGTTRVDVTLSDGTEYKDVEVIGRTANNDTLDIAFLKIKDTKGKKLVSSKLGDSSTVEVGDTVVAIGNALGQFRNTVTQGIISGYGRDLQASNESGGEVSTLENVFQTDAAINAGNSGGPLVNTSGEVIGINTAAVLEDAQSIGFAIPINDVAGLIESVIEKGTLERPYLGVMYVPLTNDTAELLDLDVKRGAYVSAQDGSSAIIKGSPAEKAGLQEGDIITKVDDTEINEENSLAAIINRHSVGDKVKLTIIRDGQEIQLEVTLSSAPTDE